jgi:tetrahydromethanopterin S-methyltransferase subunit G
MSYSMDMQNNLFGAREVVSRYELDWGNIKEKEEYIKSKVLHQLGQVIGYKIPVTKRYDKLFDSYVFEAEAVILHRNEYKELLDRIDFLEKKAIQMAELADEYRRHINYHTYKAGL